MTGLHWHHNWVHDASEKCIRADDQSRNMTVHHNVAFNCGEVEMDDKSFNSGLGLIIKGDGHVIYANTLFRSNYTGLCLPGCVEPLKAWRHQYPRDPQQNSRSQVFNVATNGDKGYPCSCHNGTAPHPPGGNQTAVRVLDVEAMKLADWPSFAFWPTQGSPLVDAGVEVPPYTDGFHGTAPDLGAYELGGEKWTAGCPTGNADREQA